MESPCRRRNDDRRPRQTANLIGMESLMARGLFFLFSLGLSLLWLVSPMGATAEDELQAGFAEEDITPRLDGKTVYMAGFGHNRKATGVHDPLKARVVVLRHGEVKIALVSVDLIGFFHPHVERIRLELPGFTYVVVSSTHNHEGPDTLGLWGVNAFQSGVDPDYLASVEKQIVRSVKM